MDRTVIYVAGVSLFAATVVLAQGRTGRETPRAPPTVDADKTFIMLDRNSDGVLSREEASRAAELEAQFDTLDTSGDGYLSPMEYSHLSTGAYQPLPRPGSATPSS